MNNKAMYEGKTVEIYAPYGGRKLDTLKVESVMGDDMDILYGESEVTGNETAYYLSDGIEVRVK